MEQEKKIKSRITQKRKEKFLKNSLQTYDYIQS